MKKIIFLLIFIFLFQNSGNTKNSKFYIGSIYSGKIKYQFIEYELPAGEWELYTYITRIPFDEIPTIKISGLSFIQTDKGTIKAIYAIGEINLGGFAPNQVGSFFVHEHKKGKYDSCILRPEYFYTNLYTKGGSSNCFLAAHVDMYKEMYFPDDPEDVGGRVKLEKYLKKNNLTLPKVMLGVESNIFIPSIKDKGIFVVYAINPELFGAPKIINAKEEKSEYHRDNIDDFPIQKKFFTDWTIEQTLKHQEFEKKLKLRSHHKLDFSDLN
tara:strand:- start:550 stop:1356 length:807 start_codon:yes stop_codon:yes gene_type:complete